MSTASEIRADWDRTFSRMTAPLDNFTASENAKALRAEEAQRAETVAERANRNRIKEMTEQNRQQLLQKYAERGVPVAADDTIEQLNKKFRAFETDRATNMLDSFDHQLSSNSEQKQSTIRDLQGLVTKQSSPAEQRKALIMTLANPAAVKDIPSEQLQKLNAVLIGPGDPEKVVRKVYDYMQNDYWFRKGSAQNKASAFYQTYLTELNSGMDKAKQIDAALLMNRLNDLDKSGQDILHQRDTHIASSSGFLPKPRIQASYETHSMAPPEKPADAFPDIAPPTGATVGPPPVDAGLPPVSGPASAGEAFDQGGFAGARDFADAQHAQSVTQNRAALGKVLGGAVDALKGGFMPQPSTNAPSMADVQANRAKVDAGLKPIIPVDQAEADAVKQAALSMGVPQEEIDKADQQLKDGTAPPNMIKAHNMMIMNIRNKRMGAVGPGSMPPPAGQPSWVPSGQEMMNMVPR